MQLSSQEIISLPQDVVWQALNDAAVLQQCIPGCEELIKQDDSHYTVKLVAAVGPVKMRMQGGLEITQSDPPNGYQLQFEGKGGAAGFAKGQASVRLTAQTPDTTLLAYEVQAQIGGKLAQVGARLIDSVAAKNAADFFESFKRVVQAPPLSEAGTAQPAGTSPVDGHANTSAAPQTRSQAVWWLVAGVSAAAAALYFIVGG